MGTSHTVGAHRQLFQHILGSPIVSLGKCHLLGAYNSATVGISNSTTSCYTQPSSSKAQRLNQTHNKRSINRYFMVCAL